MLMTHRALFRVTRRSRPNTSNTHAPSAAIAQTLPLSPLTFPHSLPKSHVLFVVRKLSMSFTRHCSFRRKSPSFLPAIDSKRWIVVWPWNSFDDDAFFLSVRFNTRTRSNRFSSFFFPLFVALTRAQSTMRSLDTISIHSYDHLHWPVFHLKMPC